MQPDLKLRVVFELILVAEVSSVLLQAAYILSGACTICNLVVEVIDATRLSL
jgi:hypothetical protein